MSLSLWKKRQPLATDATDLDRLREEMDRAITRFFEDPFDSRAFDLALPREGDWTPPLDVSETDSEVTIRAELPGIDAKDLEITVSGRTLSLAGRKEEKEEKKGENFYRCERRFGAFRRAITLPDTADTDKVSAEADNGVVTIHVQKKPGARARQIEVKPAGAARKVPVGAG